jgi:hypothetical protein
MYGATYVCMKYAFEHSVQGVIGLLVQAYPDPYACVEPDTSNVTVRLLCALAIMCSDPCVRHSRLSSCLCKQEPKAMYVSSHTTRTHLLMGHTHSAQMNRKCATARPQVRAKESEFTF